MPPLDARMTVGEWLDVWLRDYVRSTKAPRTHEMYKSIVRVHLRPRLGSVRLARLTREHDVRALAGIGETLQPSSLSRVCLVLGVALDEAVRSDRLRSNPARRVALPSVRRVERTTWTPEVINHFLDHLAGDRYALLFAFAIASGLRQGELLGLRWSDVDLVGRVLRIERQRTRDGSFADVKTTAGHRVVGLGELGRWALRAQEDQQRLDRLASGGRWANADDLVFTNALGGALHHRVVTNVFVRRCLAAGLRRIHFHDLRHANATLLWNEGEELTAIAASLGHRSVDTTRRIYAHLGPKRARATADGVDRALGRGLVDEAAGR